MSELLAEQARYYRERAGEYDEWFLREGRHDRGAEQNARWFAEVEEVRSWLRGRGPLGEVLELAAGTGLWTRPLLEQASRVTCVDVSAETLDLNRRRLANDARVEYVLADLFSWEPDRRWDTVFFGFWLSHVPADRFPAFWNLVERALAPGGHVLLVDSLPDPRSTARDQRLEFDGEVTRRLNDGRSFRIVKRFLRAPALEADLATMGWHASARETPAYFVYADLVRD